jgi:hypothetical protein
VSKGVLLRCWLFSGMRDWRLLFPCSCHVRGERPGGSRTGRSPAAGGGAAGVLEVTGPGSPMIWRRETGAGSREVHIRLFRSVPVVGSAVRAVPLAAVIPSRAAGPGGRGRMGRVRVRRGGQAGSIKGAPALPGEGGGADTGRDLAPSRWAGRTVHAARAGGCVTGGAAGALCRQRICPSRRP